MRIKTQRQALADLAQAALPLDRVASFTAMSIRDQLVGVAVLAHLSGDDGMRDAALRNLACTCIGPMTSQGCIAHDPNRRQTSG